MNGLADTDGVLKAMNIYEQDYVEKLQFWEHVRGIARQQFGNCEELLREAQTKRDAKEQMSSAGMENLTHSKTRLLILRLFQFMVSHYHGSSWNKMVETINAHKSYIADFIHGMANKDGDAVAAGPSADVDKIADGDFQKLLQTI